MVGWINAGSAKGEKMAKVYKVGDIVDCDGQTCIVTLADKEEEVIHLRFAGDDEDEVFDGITDLEEVPGLYIIA